MFEGHTHYVMQIVINPKDNNTFASASLDRTVKVWQLGSTAPNFTLEGKPISLRWPKTRRSFYTLNVKSLTCLTLVRFIFLGHDKGVNCVDYYHGGDKPYLISGADDRAVKIWDYQNKNCVQTLEGNTLVSLIWIFEEINL